MDREDDVRAPIDPNRIARTARVALGGDVRSASINSNRLARTAGVAPGTLNVWFARGLVRGVTTGTQGRARAFDFEAAVQVTILTALVRQGYAAPDAAEVANRVSARSGKVAIVRTSESDRLNIHQLDIYEAASLSEIEVILNGLTIGHPEVFTIIDLDHIVERVKESFIENMKEARGNFAM